MAALEEIITIEEICRPRTPTQFLEWFEDKLREIKETDVINDQVILREGIGKYKERGDVGQNYHFSKEIKCRK